jgi:hypothetical protein
MQRASLQFVTTPGFHFDALIDAKTLPFGPSAIFILYARNGKH